MVFCAEPTLTSIDEEVIIFVFIYFKFFFSFGLVSSSFKETVAFKVVHCITDMLVNHWPPYVHACVFVIS